MKSKKMVAFVIFDGRKNDTFSDQRPNFDGSDPFEIQSRGHAITIANTIFKGSHSFYTILINIISQRFFGISFLYLMN